jgi:hypothetical protein
MILTLSSFVTEPVLSSSHFTDRDTEDLGSGRAWLLGSETFYFSPRSFMALTHGILCPAYMQMWEQGHKRAGVLAAAQEHGWGGFYQERTLLPLLCM